MEEERTSAQCLKGMGILVTLMYRTGYVLNSTPDMLRSSATERAVSDRKENNSSAKTKNQPHPKSGGEIYRISAD